MFLLWLVGCANPPIALVYRGPAGCDGCSEPVARLLREEGFAVTFAGPDDAPITADLLATASVYAQPGGDGSVRKAMTALGDSADLIRAYVSGGGRYVGFCMGGYLAGFNPGMGMLPGDSGQLIAEPEAEVTDEADTLIHVTWGAEDRALYFQDGPYFVVDDPTDVVVLATYTTGGRIAAMTAPFGEGRVAVVGPHPEADASWYADVELDDPDGLDDDLGRALIRAAME